MKFSWSHFPFAPFMRRRQPAVHTRLLDSYQTMENAHPLTDPQFSSSLSFSSDCYFFVYFRLELPPLSLPGVTKSLLPFPALHLPPPLPVTRRYNIALHGRFASSLCGFTGHAQILHSNHLSRSTCYPKKIPDLLWLFFISWKSVAGSRPIYLSLGRCYYFNGI